MSITPILKYITKEINWYYSKTSAEDFARLGNISRMENSSNSTNADLQDKIILTIVNIEEEKTLKNNPHYVKQGDVIQKRNPTLFLNLYILISCAADDYETALTKISNVIAFFQQKNVFTAENAEVSFPEEHVEKIMMDVFSMNFEQINHLWGILGGKYIPSVLYKLRILPVQKSELKGADVIRAIRENSSGN